MQRVTRSGLAVAEVLADFVETEALPGTGIDADAYWEAFAGVVRDLAPRNRALLDVRDRMQASIDDWHRANGAPSDMAAYRGFLREIGYLVDEGPDFAVETSGVDPEIGADLRTAARGSAVERTVRAQRGECALGIAL